jgi:hypothetical protein
MSEPAVVETTPAATPAQTVQAAFAQAKAAQTTPAPEAKPEVKTEAAPETPNFFKAKAEEKPPTLDWVGLSEDEKKNGYLRQQDYTKKTQELAVQRAEIQARREEFEKYAKLLTERSTATGGQTTPESGPTDPMDQVQALRDAGEWAKADQLLLDTVKGLAEQSVEPIKKEAEVARLQATFQNVTTEAMAQPIVKHYAKEVAAVFDSNAPVVQAFRQVALSSPENMKLFIPAFTYLLACEQDAKAQAATFDKRLQEGIEKGIAERRAAANKVPGKVVESAAQSRESAPGKMSLQEAYSFAKGGGN